MSEDRMVWARWLGVSSGLFCADVSDGLVTCFADSPRDIELAEKLIETKLQRAIQHLTPSTESCPLKPTGPPLRDVRQGAIPRNQA